MSVPMNAIRAALAGPGVEKIKISEPNSSETHEFNIKPVSYRVLNGETTVYGQLSHHLTFRKDDQIWFAFKKNGRTTTPTVAQKMVVEKEEGGAISTITMLKPVGVAIGAYFGVDAGKYFDMINNHSNDLDFVDLDGDWEKAAENFIQELAKQTTPPREKPGAGLQFFEHSDLKGNKIFIRVGQNIEHTKTIGWNDKASSILANVPAGKKLELYQHDNFKGRVLELGPGTHIIRDLKIHKLGDELTSVLWENS